MSATVPDATILLLAACVGLSAAMALEARSARSTLALRLAALLLAAWAILATTSLATILATGSAAAARTLVTDPTSLLGQPSLALWLVGSLGAFAVFLVAFALSQAVDRGLMRTPRTRELPWPPILPAPPTPTIFLAFVSADLDAFTFTLLERAGPRTLRCRDVVMVSEGLLAALSPTEWLAVAAHELAHARALDGRYLTFFRTFARMMRWDPVLASVATLLTRREEFRADLASVAMTGRPRALARALFKVASAPVARPSTLPRLLGATGRRGRSDAFERIRRLLALAESGRFPEEGDAASDRPPRPRADPPGHAGTPR